MDPSFRNHPLRAELSRIYREVDERFAGIGCDRSTDCCRFGVTGREPYPTAIERAEVALALADRGGPPKRRKLPLAERPCELLTDEGRCSIYAARPFGCRTFFCDRADPVPDVPRTWIRDASAQLASLSERWSPVDPGPRPLSHVSHRRR